MSHLHSYLISLQSIKELTRKAKKARRRGYVTEEEIDLMACDSVRAMQPLWNFDKKLSKALKRAITGLNK